MKSKFNLFRRGAVFYMEDTATGKQTSLRTKDETEAKSLLEARNAAQRQPTLNLHLARAYLTASDPATMIRFPKPVSVWAASLRMGTRIPSVVAINVIPTSRPSLIWPPNWSP